MNGEIRIFRDPKGKPYSVGFKNGNSNYFYHTPYDSYKPQVTEEGDGVATFEKFYLPDCTSFETISQIDIKDKTYKRQV